MKKPKIRTQLPGPKAANLIEYDDLYVSPSYTRGYPLVAESGKGMWITDPDGNVFMDFAAGIAVCSTGHCHPKVVRAIKRQAGKLIHMSGTDFYYRSQSGLAMKLAQVATVFKCPVKVYFGNSGAEAVEAAFKLARWYTKRPVNIAFYGAFHGRTMGALSLTGSKDIQKNSFYPLVPHVIHVPYANCYRCHYGLEYPKCDIECVRWIEDELFHTIAPPEQIASVFVEPIQGEGGYIVPPIEFHKKLRALTKKYGILYVADEVQSGMGRTGEMFATDLFDVEPDIITLAKGIASGMPLGAVIASAEIMSWPPGAHASTFGGNPIACEAALATIDLLENGLISNSMHRGMQLRRGLRKLQYECEWIGDVRGEGLMTAIEFVEDRESKKPFPEFRDKVVDDAFYKGLLLLGCGKSGIRFSPPLIVSKNDIDVCLNILDEILNTK